MKKDNIIRDKSFQFACDIARYSRFLMNEKKEYVLSKQLLRSGTAIGALVRESERAESKTDFLHKLSLHAKKQMKQSTGWTC